MTTRQELFDIWNNINQELISIEESLKDSPTREEKINLNNRYSEIKPQESVAQRNLHFWDQNDENIRNVTAKFLKENNFKPSNCNSFFQCTIEDLDSFVENNLSEEIKSELEAKIPSYEEFLSFVNARSKLSREEASILRQELKGEDLKFVFQRHISYVEEHYPEEHYPQENDVGLGGL